MSVGRNRFSFAGMSEQKDLRKQQKKIYFICSLEESGKSKALRLCSFLFLREEAELKLYKPIPVRVKATGRINF